MAAATASQENPKRVQLLNYVMTAHLAKSLQLVLQCALLSVLLERGGPLPLPHAFRVLQDFFRIKLDSHPNHNAQHAAREISSGR